MPLTVERLPGTGGIRLHALVWPGRERRPAFLLVHGLSSNCRTWEAVGDALHERGHAVAAVDLRGHGQSEKPDGGYDFATFGADLLAVLDALGWERSIVAGQSTGGNVAVELAVAAPDRLDGAVGVDGGVLELVDEWPEWADCLQALAPPEFAGTPAVDVERRIRRTYPHWSDTGVAATMANLHVRPDGTVEPWLTRERHLRILRALWEQRPSTLLERLTVPLLLLLAGPDDRKRMQVQRAHDRAGHGVRAIWFEGGDHDLHVQQPVTVAAVLAGAVGDGFFAS
ncbi:MAG: alpha/beta fold hydrolase [Acidimicrobiales bacterium]